MTMWQPESVFVTAERVGKKEFSLGLAVRAKFSSVELC